MNVATNIGSMRANMKFAELNNKASEAINRVSSGLRINKGADDPSGLARSTVFKTQIRSQNMAMRNVQDDLSLFETQSSGLNQISSLLQRMRDIAVRAGNDATLSSGDYNKLAEEYSSLVTQVNTVANATKYNASRQVLHGIVTGVTSSDLEFMLEWNVLADMDIHVVQPDGAHAWWADQDPSGHGVIDIDNTWGALPAAPPAVEHYNVPTGAALTGNYDLWVNYYWDNSGGTPIVPTTVTVSMYRGTPSENIQTFTVNVPYQSGDDPFMGAGAPYGESFVGSFFWQPLVSEPPPTMFVGGGQDVANDNFDDFTFYESRGTGLNIAATSVASAGAASGALTAIDAAIEKVAGYQIEIGSNINRFNSIMNSLQNSNINLASANSAIIDADLAAELTEITKAGIVSSASMQAINILSNLPGDVLNMITDHQSIMNDK